MKWIIVILAVTLLVGAGVFVNLKGNDAPSNGQSTDEWKLYRNEKYGFEFKYPERRSVSEYGSLIMVGAIAPLITVETSDVSRERESVFDRGGGVIIKNIIFAGKVAKQYDCPQSNPCPLQFSSKKAIRLTDLPKNWKAGNEINYDLEKGDENEKALADQILSTFKFIP